MKENVPSTEAAAEPVEADAKDARSKAAERIGLWIKQKWLIESVLGVGGMAAVYGARHRNGSRAALKILHSEFARDASIKERFLREGYVANKVDHPGRVKILDDDVTDAGEPFLVMELLEGETLQQLWRRKKRRVPPVEALRIAEKVLDALAAFHEQKIVHRDLKPANVFVTHEGAVKLLDFGVAQMREGATEHTRAGMALGTPSYMAPEQAMGKSDTVDGRADIYALGATLYALMSGQRLHQNKSDNEAFILAATQPAPSVARVAPELPVSVVALVDKALQWDRRNRFADAPTMRTAVLAEIAALEGASTPRETAGETAFELEAERPSAAGPAGPVTSQSFSGPSTSPSRGGPVSSPSQRTGPGTPAPSTPASGESRSAATVASPGAGLRPAPRSGPQGLQSGPPASGPDSLAPPSGGRSHVTASRQAVARAEPESTALVELFRRVERLAITVRQYRTGHPEVEAKMRSVVEATRQLLREGEREVRFGVQPFGFALRGTTLWEPSPPDDLVTYHLSVAGLREVRIRREAEDDEIRALFRMITEDAAATDADLVGTLWELRLPHVELRIDDAAADPFGDEARADEARVLEAMAREDMVEAAAMALNATGGQARADAIAAAAASRSALDLDRATRAGLAAQLDLGPERWRERFLDVLVDGIEDAARRQDVALLVGPLETYSADLARRRRWGELLEVHRQLDVRLRERLGDDASELAAVLFRSYVLRQMCGAATGGPGTARDEPAEVLEGLREVLASLDARALDDCLAAAEETPAGDAQEALFGFVRRVLPGNEAAVAARIESLRGEVALRLMRLLVEAAPEDLPALVAPLADSKSPALRCEAIAAVARSPEQLKSEMLRLVDGEDGSLRAAALGVLVRQALRSAGPELVRRVQLPGFMARPAADQRALFEAMYALSGARAEEVLTAVVGQHGLTHDPTLDATRTLAVELLGARAASQEALDAAVGAARRRWWNGPALREAAGKAAEAIAARLGTSFSAGGGEP
ncbi:MAG: protein kinase [Polyangiaceae bacterium]|nr:protein kinase [Polyangiaceae bacterium]